MNSFSSAPFRRRATSRALCVALCLSFAAGNPAHAQGTAEPREQQAALREQNALELAFARRALAEKRPDLACALLVNTLPQDDTEAERMLLLGRCSSAKQEREQAEQYYRRAIALAPAAAAPKVELAGLYLAGGRRVDAASLLSQAADASEGQARVMLDQLTAQLRPNDPVSASLGSRDKPWALQAYMGLTWDDNTNAGPVSRSVPAVLGGIPITFDLVADAMPRKSAGAALGLNGSYAVRLDERFSLLFQAAWSGTGYFDRQDYNNDSTTLASALIYSDKAWSASLQPNVRYTRLDGRLQETSPGMVGRVARAVNDTVSLTATGGYAKRIVHTDSSRDADAWQGGVGAIAQLTPALLVGGEYLWQREQARETVYSRRLSGPSAYLQYRICSDVLLGANVSYTDVRYDQAMALFDQPRADRQITSSLSALWDISRHVGRNMVIRAQYTHIDNPSNIGYGYFRRNMANLGVQMQF
ncbi:surface lipoprotein assembly modifier [Herbaspirillum sp. NPDC101396]|uniref:surface lipoprotein assembly modifier n=1 Tax=Herbaspirillum sp. NPDC101396 TaxID=3364005 RepID=UPI00383A63FB